MRLTFSLKYILLIFFMACPIDMSVQAKSVDEMAVDFLIEKAKYTDFWSRIHALEFLNETGHVTLVRKLLKKTFEGMDTVPQKRIGYWRCCAETSTALSEKKKYISKILDVYLSSSSPDKVYAAESMAKLKCSLRSYPRQTLLNDSLDNILQGYILWAKAIPESDMDTVYFSSVFSVLESDNDVQRNIMAYGLKYMSAFPEKHWKRLVEMALIEPQSSLFAVRLLHGSIAVCPDKKVYQNQVEQIRTLLLKYLNINDNEIQYETCLALGKLGDQRELNKMESIFMAENKSSETVAFSRQTFSEDLKMAAAYAVLKIMD